MAERERPDCLHCRHFFLEWATSRRGCRAYGFRCTSYPSHVVERSSGVPCQLFEEKATPTRRRAGLPDKPRKR